MAFSISVFAGGTSKSTPHTPSSKSLFSCRTETQRILEIIQSNRFFSARIADINQKTLRTLPISTNSTPVDLHRAQADQRKALTQELSQILTDQNKLVSATLIPGEEESLGHDGLIWNQIDSDLLRISRLSSLHIPEIREFYLNKFFAVVDQSRQIDNPLLEASGTPWATPTLGQTRVKDLANNYHARIVAGKVIEVRFEHSSSGIGPSAHPSLRDVILVIQKKAFKEGDPLSQRPDEFYTEVKLSDILALHQLQKIDKPNSNGSGKPIIAEVMQYLDNVSNPLRRYSFDPLVAHSEKTQTQKRFQELAANMTSQNKHWLRVEKQKTHFGKSVDFQWPLAEPSKAQTENADFPPQGSIDNLIGKTIFGLQQFEVVMNEEGKFVPLQGPKRPGRYLPETTLHEIFVGEVKKIHYGIMGSRGTIIDFKRNIEVYDQLVPVSIEIQGPYGRQTIHLPGPEELYYHP